LLTPRSARRCAICGSIFDAPRLKSELASLETKISDPTVWADAARSQPLMRERKRLESLLANDAELGRRSDDIEAYFDLMREGEGSVEPELKREIDSLVEFTDALESRTMLSEENDLLNAIVTVHPGAGGTESQDWAEMLMRMYLRWAERQGFKTEINELQDGDEAGIKSATFTVTGDTHSACSRARPACIAWCASRRSIRPSAATPASPASSSRRRSTTRSPSTSSPTICASTPIAPAARAASM
jgi:peptide chain release factor 2